MEKFPLPRLRDYFEERATATEDLRRRIRSGSEGPQSPSFGRRCASPKRRLMRGPEATSSSSSQSGWIVTSHGFLRITTLEGQLGRAPMPSAVLILGIIENQSMT